MDHERRDGCPQARLMRLPTLRPRARILFITNTRIGDAVLSTGLLGLLTETYPTARITVVVGYLACSLFDAAPCVERVIALRKQQYNRHWLGLYASLFRSWDLIVDLRGSATAWLVPTRYRRVLNRSDPARSRVVELGHLVYADPPPAPRLWIKERDRQAAARLVPTDLAFLAVAPGASSPEKRWPAERFAAMIDRLTAPDAPGATLAVTLLGAADERWLIDAVLRRLAERPGIRRPLVVLGEARLPVVAAILERARLYIGNDSGLMHLAAASGAPTVGLFGPTPATRYRPWGERTLVVQPEDPQVPGALYAPPQPIADLRVERVVDRVRRFAAEYGLASGIDSDCVA
jgi:lipopolysaccharide export system permease protein